MGVGCSTCGQHPLLLDEAAKQVNTSENSSRLPDGATSSSFDGSETNSTAARSVGTFASSSGASWCPAGGAEFRSPAEVARVAKLAARSGSRLSTSSRQSSHRMSLENADSVGGLVWMPLPGTPAGQQPALESASTPSLCSLSTRSSSPAGGLASGSLHSGSIGSVAASSGGLACSSLDSVDTAGSGALGSSAAGGSLARMSGVPCPARAQAREALQATLHQLVKLPFREFLRAAPPRMGLNGTPMEAGDANFGYLGRNPPPAVEDLLTELVRGAGVDTAILTMNASRRVWVRNNAGFRPGTFPWCWSAWQSRAPQPQLLVVPDTLAVRGLATALEAVPAGDPRVRFFAGIPLLGPGGLVLGSLCLVGREPQQPTDAQCSALTELAERVAAELAKDTIAVQLLQGRPGMTVSSGDVQPMESAAVNAMRKRAVLFTDAAQQPWSVLHANARLAEVAGIDAHTAAGQPLWRLFARPFAEDSPAWEAAMEVAARGDEFILRCCRVTDAPERGTYSLQFRPADQGGLDDDAELADLPAQLPSAPGDAGHPFFVVVTPEASPTGADSRYTPVQALNASKQRPLSAALVDGLELGPLLARGSFGSVFRGRFKGQKVAVKVCTGNMRSTQGHTLKPWKNMEALQVRKLRHPNIVAALKHATVIDQDGDLQASSWSNSSGERNRPRSGSQDTNAVDTAGTTSSPCTESAAVAGDMSQSEAVSSGRCSTVASWSEDESSDADAAAPNCSVEMETWLVMEYCNRGTLRSGVERGYFSSRTQQPQSHLRADAPQHNVANLPVVLAVAAEIASAMAYLHSRNVVHGDLCGSNVMLTTDKGKRAGFTAKIADFGLSRQLKAQTICTATYGTVTHMPPELMLQQKLTTAADVFSFGVLLWEMANSAQAWEGMTHTQVITKVALEHQRLPWPAHAPPAVKDLSVRCTLRDHEARPTFPAIQEELAALQAALQQQPTH